MNALHEINYLLKAAQLTPVQTQKTETVPAPVRRSPSVNHPAKWWSKGDYRARISRVFGEGKNLDREGLRRWYESNDLDNATDAQREAAIAKLDPIGDKVDAFSGKTYAPKRGSVYFRAGDLKGIDLNERAKKWMDNPNNQKIFQQKFVRTGQNGERVIDREAAQKYFNGFQSAKDWAGQDGVMDRMRSAFTGKDGNIDQDLYNKWWKENNIGGNINNEERERLLSNAEQLRMWRSQNTDALRRKFRTDAEAANFLRSNPAFMSRDNAYRNMIMATMKDKRGYVDPVGTEKQNMASANRAARTVNGMRQAQQGQIQADRLRMAQFRRGAKRLNGRTGYGYNRWW